ncbi:cytochrome P450 [Streptomyces sp. NPDC093595]|uniref:cytochrome P450 n=1 Tax=Streptomyces sp. NPDC093595 TaxID=3366045 RepID=UPI00380602BF
MSATTSCPPAPGGVPLLGHAPALLRRPLSFFESSRTADPLVRVGFGPIGLYLANDPALVHRIQVDTDTFERGRFFERLAANFGNPLIASNGPEHQHQRRTLKPAFSRRSVRDHTAVIAEEAERRLGGWRPGAVVAADEEMSDLVTAVVLRCLFSTELPPAVVSDIRTTLYMIARRLLARTVFPDAVTEFPTPGNRRFKAAVNRFHTTVDRMVAERRAAPAGDHPDVLDALLATRHPATGQPLTGTEIRSELLMLLFAALETTSTTLSWAVFEATVRPEVQERLRKEADAVLGDGPVGYDRLHDLAYTRRVLHETLRLRSPMLFTRRTRHDVVLAGVAVPAGSEVGYSPRAMHRDPVLYPDPRQFDPDRSAPESGQVVTRGAYFPFGTGPHRCIGEHLAMTVMTVALATLFSRWRLRVAPGTRIREANSSLPHPSSLPLVPTPHD